MSALWKIIVAIIIIIGAYIGYEQFVGSNAGNEEQQTSISDEMPKNKMEPASGSQLSRQSRTDLSRPISDEEGLAELEKLAQAAEEEEKLEEEIYLNEETGELIIKDPVTGKVVFTTIVEKELIPLTKQGLELEIPADLPEEAFADQPNAQAAEPAVSVYPPEESGQVPEQVILKDGDDVKVIDVPQDAKDLKFVSSVPEDDSQDNE